MSKVKKEDNVIVIEEEVMLPGTDIILEKGDKIKILDEQDDEEEGGEEEEEEEEEEVEEKTKSRKTKTEQEHDIEDEEDEEGANVQLEKKRKKRPVLSDEAKERIRQKIKERHKNKK